MNQIKCSIKDCEEVFQTEETVSPVIRFICKNHPRQIQLNAVGRTFKSRKDDRDADVHFQSVQFDPGLVKMGRPPNIDFPDGDDRSDD